MVYLEPFNNMESLDDNSDHYDLDLSITNTDGLVSLDEIQYLIGRFKNSHTPEQIQQWTNELV